MHRATLCVAAAGVAGARGETVDFFPLLVVSLLAVAVPVLLHRIPRVRVPIVVGEIIAGIAVGRSGLDLIAGDNPYLDFLKIFGFTYLMFLSGLEIDFNLLLRRSAPSGEVRRSSNPIVLALLSFTACVGLSLAVSLVLVRIGLVRDAVIMALVLSTTSLGVVMPVLKERDLTRTPLGQNILVLSVVGDFATVLLISVYVVFHTSGLTFELLFVLVLLAVTFLVYRLARLTRRHLPLEKIVEDLSHATGQLDTRGALALAVVFIALAQGLGIEVILGAFLAGTMVSLLSRDESSALRGKLNALGYGFFIPIFFIMVGVEFDLPALVGSRRSLLLVPALVGLAFLVKYAGALVYRWIFSWKDVLALGTLTSSRLSLIIAVAEIGVERGAIPEAANSAIILLAIVTVFVSPVLFNRMVSARPEGARRILIVGAPPHARLLAQRLSDHGENVRILTANDRYFKEATSSGLDAVLVEKHGEVEGLREGGVDEARAVICMLDDETDAFRVATAARHTFGVETVVAYVQDPLLGERLRAHDVHILDPGLSLAVMLEAMVRHPRVFSLLSEVGSDRHVLDVQLRNAALEGRALRDVPLPGDALIFMVSRGGEVIIPRGYTRLRRGDLLTLVGSRDAVREAAAVLAA